MTTNTTATNMITRNDFDSLTSFCEMPFVGESRNAERCHELLGKPGAWIEGRKGHDAQRWFGASSANEAGRRVTHGWPEGANRVMANLANIAVAAPVSVRRRMTRTDQGDELDIHAVNRGDLDHAWTARKRRQSRGKLTVRLVIQTNLMARMSSEELFWRGATAVKFSDLLSEAGYNVEIVGAIASYNVGGITGDVLTTFTLKPASAPLDIESLAGVICNAGFHRLFGFRSYFCIAPNPHLSVGTASSCIDGRIIREANFSADGVRTFVVPYAVASKESAQRWLETTITALDAATIE